MNEGEETGNAMSQIVDYLHGNELLDKLAQYLYGEVYADYEPGI